MNYKYILTATLLASLFCGTASAWLSGYDHRMPITVNNGKASELTYCQFNFTNDTNVLVAAGHMQASGADCRITDASDNLLPFWNETPFNAAGTKIWVNATTLAVGNNTFYMYYGNATASSMCSGADTFLFFDDVEQGNNIFLFDYYENNPILEVGDAGSWTAQHLYLDSVIWDGSRYLVYWNGRSGEGEENSIGVATSDDGYNFTVPGTGETQGKSLIPEGDEGTYVGFSYAFYEDGMYYLIYRFNAYVQDGGLKLASSPNGTSGWTRLNDNNPILNFSASGWDSGPADIRCESLVKSGDTYFLYYTIAESSTSEKIGVATSTNITGPYTKYSGNPIFEKGSAAFEEYGQWAPDIFKIGDVWYMVYAGQHDFSTYGHYNKMRLAVATSMDGYNWTPVNYNDQPFWGYNSSHSWENYYITRSSIIPDPNSERQLLFYCADTVSGGHDSIGVANGTYLREQWFPQGDSGSERIEGWVDEGASPIAGNHSLKCTGIGANRDYIFLDVNRTDVAVRAKIKSSAIGSEQGIGVRMNLTSGSDNSQGYGMWADRGSGFYLSRMDNSSVTILDSDVAHDPAGNTWTIEIGADGNNIFAKIWDSSGALQNTLVATDSNYSSQTKVGLGSKGDYTSLFDQIFVRSYNSPEPTATLGAEETGGSGGGAYNITLPLGWSIIGWTSATPTTAHSMGGMIGGNCTFVTERNATTGEYVTHVMTGPAGEDNFAINRGWGYFVKLSAETLWERDS